MNRFLETFFLFLSITGIISVIGQQTHDAVRTPCDHNNGGCSSTCLISTKEQGYSCACPTGIPLLSDKKTCAHEGQSFLLVADTRYILKISLDDPNYAAVKLPLDNINKVIDIDFDPLEGKIYWTDFNSRAIRRAYLNGSGQQDLVSSDLLSPIGIAIDYIARTLYWADWEKNRIEMSNLNGTNRTVIIRDKNAEPRGIVVDPKTRRIYWTDLTKPRIESSSLDGTNRSVIIGTNEGTSLSLALDDEHKIIYWGNPRTKTIEMANVDGSNRSVLISDDISYISGFSLLGDYIYWTDLIKQVVERAHRLTGDKRQVIVSKLYNPLGLKAFIVRNVKEQTCDSLVNPQHGYIRELTNNSINSVATFACHPEYRIVGEENATCLWIDNKPQWSNPSPQCIKSDGESCAIIVYESGMKEILYLFVRMFVSLFHHLM